MIWQSHICSKFAAFLRRGARGNAALLWRGARGNAAILLVALAWAAPAGTVSGRVDLVSSHNPNVRRHTDYSGVVLWLEPLSGAPVLPASARRAQMIQKNKTFLPHVLAVSMGTIVDFPNFDPIFHNAFSNYNGQIFDVGLYAPGSTRALAFRREGVVRVFCNIHPTMSAVIVVLRSPYFTVSDKKGGFQIGGVPPGSYRLHVFHERSTAETLAALTRPIEVAATPLEIAPIQVSESGYLEVPHKNKFGKDYPPESDSGYLGAKP